MITSYVGGSAMLKSYIDLNGIKDCFVFKEGDKCWQVYVGDVTTMQGFKEGEPFKTKRDALDFVDRVQNLINSVK
jgi:hypothetical protein